MVKLKFNGSSERTVKFHTFLHAGVKLPINIALC